MADIELTTVPTETSVAVNDIEYFVDVSETPDAINQITTQNRHNSFAASTTEVLTGTSVDKHVTPDALAALWEQGSDIASAATISVGEGGQFNVTGTTTITDIDFATDKAGRTVWLKFAGILTLTHHSTTLILPTGANITTAAGDIACFRSEGSDNVRCISYQRASGAALAGSGGIGGSTESTDNAILKADGTGGSTLQAEPLAILGDNGEISLMASGFPFVYIDPANGGKGTVQVDPNGTFNFAAAGNTAAGTMDTGTGRFAAGVMKATNGSTGIRGFMGGGTAVASATALPLPTGRVFHVTGTTTITSITATNLQAGVVVTLIFDDILTFTDGSNLKLAGNFVTSADDTITLAYDGTNFYEMCRSVN